jgi:ribosomal protein S18 acetylase RimI-like enzyme
MTIQIRNFNFPADYESVHLIWQNAGDGIGLGPSDEPDEIAKKSRHDPDLFLVAEADGLLVGTVMGGFDGRRGMVYHLAIIPDFQKQGLARQLMTELETRLRARGCRKAYLLIKKGNETVSSFYQKQGWEEMDYVYIYGKKF